MNAAKTVLVTGAARRIGAAIARGLHADGWNLVLHAHRSEGEAEALCHALNQTRAGSATFCKGDLLQADTPEALAQHAYAAWGRLDALVNNASSYYATPLGQITAEALDDLLGTNLRAPLLLTQACVPRMSAGGAIVNLIDINARRPRLGYSAYCAAKAGLWAATEALALELAPRIRVNGVAPGYVIWTDADGFSPEEQQQAEARVPLQRLAGAEAIANTVRFLLSEEASYIHGAVLPVDGGLSLT